MNCPKCDKDMILGEIANIRGDTSLYWAPKTFFDKHWLNTYNHTKKTIEAEGGIITKTNSKWQKAAVCYGCTDCKLIVVDCN